MGQAADYVGKAKVFWSGRSQAVRLPAPCRFHVTEVEVVKQGDTVTLRPLGKGLGQLLRVAPARQSAASRAAAASRTRRLGLMYMLDTDICVYALKARNRERWKRPW